LAVVKDGEAIFRAKNIRDVATNAEHVSAAKLAAEDEHRDEDAEIDGQNDEGGEVRGWNQTAYRFAAAGALPRSRA
jgi:hypothetical protein